MNIESLSKQFLLSPTLVIDAEPFFGAEMSIIANRSGKQKLQPVVPEELTTDCIAVELRDKSGQEWVGLVTEESMKVFWLESSGTVAGRYHEVYFEEISFQ